MLSSINSFREGKPNGPNWITLSTGEFYPNILAPAVELYTPVLVMFGQLVRTSESSIRLFEQINDVKETWMRVQLLRVFRKYVSPGTSVEMTKRKTKAQLVINRFGQEFRPIQEVQASFFSRPLPDEAMCALLWEYKNRGTSGYDLTERFFMMIRHMFPELPITGPERAGQDIRMGTVFKDYPNQKRPVDFVIYGEDNLTVLAIGLARYDSDRGGAQEDDRTGGYQNVAREIITYANSHGMNTKVIFVNDGPGLLLGSMWEDYSSLEEAWPGRIKVVTLRMVEQRITKEWLLS